MSIFTRLHHALDIIEPHTQGIAARTKLIADSTHVAIKQGIAAGTIYHATVKQLSQTQDQDDLFTTKE